MIYILLTIFSFIIIYSVIPTVLIRIFGIGITKRIDADGIALTFDDGPNPLYTPQLLDLLKKYEIKASFFVVGSKAQKNPEIIKRMNEEGHTIGIHHFNHLSNWILSPFQLKKQLEQTEMAIRKSTNEQVTFYRPPWGHFNIFTLFVSKKYKKIMWSNIFGDWKVEKCKNHLLEQLRETTKPGSILLLHDCGQTLGADSEAPHYMMKDLEIFLQENKERGTRFITLKEI